MIFDETRCKLGEGPLWHPLRKQLFWFDIIGQHLHSRTEAGPRRIDFDEAVSAAGWIDQDTLFVATETAFRKLDIDSGTHEKICDFDAENPLTRSNDGRADPWGGFWIGTMSKGDVFETGAGAIYRYYRGEVRVLFDAITIPNAMCFSPDRQFAYYTDTETKIVMRQRLAALDGWPEGDPEAWLDLRGGDVGPDGAVIDAAGNMWLALWGGSRVSCFSPEGVHLRDIEMPALQITCPAFGGDDLSTLFVTSAAVGLEAGDHGKTFSHLDIGPGQAEHQVIL